MGEGPSGLLRLLRAGALETKGTSFVGIELHADASGAVSNFSAIVLPLAHPAVRLAILPSA